MILTAIWLHGLLTDFLKKVLTLKSQCLYFAGVLGLWVNQVSSNIKLPLAHPHRTDGLT
jgi:hypothetical protein